MKINGIGKAGLFVGAAFFPLDAALGIEKVQGDDLMNLPWADLSKDLSSSDILVESGPADYVAQCVPEYEKENGNRSNYNLIEQPSGLCMNQLSCGFKDCTPVNEGYNNVSWSEWWSEWSPPSTKLEEGNLPTWLDPKNPLYNLPSKVLFPTLASDVVAAVGFAQLHNVELSVKNSGHHYMGASSKKDTLHINMNKYKRYAAVDGPIECKNVQDTLAEDLSNQACKLALARGRQGAIRIGGGENWDKVYRAVKAFNEQQPDGYKYHAVGGGAGSVSPMGWTWQAGLASQARGRKYGLGVDQVLQIEMVLPNGLHVRFGPTGWEESDGYYYPKTTKVSGVCNQSPTEDDENMWEWKTCPEDVNFDDLWFAVRGGGGGTWGVVLSVYVQLHDYLPLEYVPTPVGIMLSQQSLGEVFPPAFVGATWEFLMDFMFNPSALGLSDDDSNNCGHATSAAFFCYGEGSGTLLLTTWKDFLISKNATLLSMGVPLAFIDGQIGIASTTSPTKLKDYAELFLKTEGPHEGKVDDNEKPQTTPSPGSAANFLLPKTCILENRDSFLPAFAALPPQQLYYAFGVNAGISNDQTTSVSAAYHEAGVQFFTPISKTPEMSQEVYEGFLAFYESIVSTCYDTGDKDNFPPMYGSNHAGPNLAGPLKSDWTKPCPAEWTREMRESDCISIQEAIYGTKLLKRLEEIKKSIDPTYMFDCYKCIGNNREKQLQDKPYEESELFESEAYRNGGSSATASYGLFTLVFVGLVQLLGCAQGSD